MGCASLKLNEKEQKQLAKQLEHTSTIGQILNKIRKQPDLYAKIIEHQMQSFQKNPLVLQIKQGCNTINYETIEGIPAWKQAVKFLKSQYPISSQLTKNTALCEAAAYRAKYYAHKQQFPPKQDFTSSHNISRELQTISGSKVKPGDYAVIVGMDFKLKDRNYVENALMGLIIDDGTPQRTNRNHLFSQSYKYYGCSTIIIKQLIYVVVCLSSENLINKI